MKSVDLKSVLSEWGFNYNPAAKGFWLQTEQTVHQSKNLVYRSECNKVDRVGEAEYRQLSHQNPLVILSHDVCSKVKTLCRGCWCLIYNRL